MTLDLSGQESFEVPGLVKVLDFFCRHFVVSTEGSCSNSRTPDEVLFSLEGQKEDSCGDDTDGILEGS